MSHEIAPSDQSAGAPTSHHRASLAGLTLTALGVVYGDIGTSPLYALKEVFGEQYGIAPDTGNVLGVLSLVLWTLTVVVSLKYVTLILRASNRGEGGIMAIVALAMSAVAQASRWRVVIMLLGFFGAALFYGDGVITPAISVLSAIEGLEVATPAFKPYVIPLTLAVLAGLYVVQKGGTRRIGNWFGPVMIVWFVTIGALGAIQVAAVPAVLAAVDPLRAIDFLLHHRWAGFVVLGAVVLTVTGAEALYADLGHFGTRPIRLAWFAMVFPALALSYLGQGALILGDPSAVANPFFRLVPDWGVIPMVMLSTVATVIASQATISGTFSLTRQAIQLGFMPRMRIVHTSDESIGQIYIPAINWAQFVFVVGAVLGFGSSTNLASAYGLAVTGTMLITTLLTFFVIRMQWKYPLAICIAATGFFIAVDCAFLGANLLKIPSGGWFPLALGVVVYGLMLTWHRGRELVQQAVREDGLAMDGFLASLFSDPPPRVSGNAVFLRARHEAVPRALMHNLFHNKVVHERIVFVTVAIAEEPFVPAARRIEFQPLGHECYQVTLRFGFKDDPDIPTALQGCGQWGLVLDPMRTSYFISQQTIVPTARPGMARWREQLFVTMVKNAASATDHFFLPVNRVVEMGAKVEI